MRPARKRARNPRTSTSIDARRGSAVDRNRRPLDVLRTRRAEKQCEFGDIFRCTHPTRAAFGDHCATNLVGRFALRGGALLNQLLGPLGGGLARMDGIDVDAVAHNQAGRVPW